MSNLSLGIILIISACIGLPVFFQSIRRRRERDASLFYSLMCISNALWAVFNALFYLIPDGNAALLFYELRFVFVSYSALFTFLFVLQSLKHRLPGKPVLALLCVVPLITLALVLTNQFHHLMRVDIGIRMVDGVRTITNENGPWFWVHCAYCYTLMLLAGGLMIQQYRRLPQNFRLPIAIMLCSLLLTMAATLLSIFDLLPLSIDAAPIVVQISQIIFYYTLYHSHSLDILFTSRDAVFENAGHAIFILDVDGRIMDYNQQATLMGRDVGISSLYERPYRDVLDQWIKAYGGRIFQEDASIFTIHRDETDVNYQVASADIFNQHHKAIGSYTEVKNITPMMSLVHKLQDFAYYDQLTGLRNRRSLVYELGKLDSAEYLPLGIVAGDVNRLKRVNDTHGHATGDLLLQSITKILVQSSPEKTLWFRAGGDEFIALNPRTNDGEMSRLLDEVRERCAALTDPRFLGADIALAYRMQTDPAQNIQDLLDNADRAMYTDKNDRRAPLIEPDIKNRIGAD